MARVKVEIQVEYEFDIYLEMTCAAPAFRSRQQDPLLPSQCDELDDTALDVLQLLVVPEMPRYIRGVSLCRSAVARRVMSPDEG